MYDGGGNLFDGNFNTHLTISLLKKKALLQVPLI